MARSSSSSQRIWQSLKPVVQANRWSLGVALLVTSSAVVGLSLTLSNPSDRQVKGLHQLARSLQLFQSFRADPSQPPPLLWQRRLGVMPSRAIWRRLGRGVWWQGWSVDGQAYLVLPSSLLTQQDRARANSFGLDGVVVLSADALNQQHLRERLVSLGNSGAEITPLLSNCLQRLERGPAVVWRPDLIARFSGSSAPLLQAAGYGCLSLRIRNRQLQWYGWVGSRDLAVAPPQLNPQHAGFPEEVPSSTHDSPQARELSDPLLMLEGERLGVLLSALASREIIRRPLEQNYALGNLQQTKLLNAPFRLRLVLQPQGTFKAGIQLQLWPDAERESFERSLRALAGRLSEQGLVAAPGDNTIWRDSDPSNQSVLGGWRWLQPQSTRPVLSLGLGMAPSSVPLAGVRTSPAERGAMLELRARPADLAKNGLLDGQWPRVVTQAQTLSLRLHRMTTTREASPWVELSGQLALSDAAEF